MNKEEKKALRKAKRKESWRKFIVSLKKRPHNIPLVFMLITYVFFSLNLTKISNTTALINKNPMGLCTFVVMLFSILALVSFLNAFPKRQNPKKPMVIVMFVLIALCVTCDVVYLLKMTEYFNELQAGATLKPFVKPTEAVVIIHLILQGISVGLIVSIKALGKAFNKIDTSVKLADNDIGEIEIED